MPKLDGMQNKATRVNLRAMKDMSIETTRYLLNLSPVETRQEVEQIKVCLGAIQTQTNKQASKQTNKQTSKQSLQHAVQEETGCRLATGKSWMGQAEQSIQHVCIVIELRGRRERGGVPR